MKKILFRLSFLASLLAFSSLSFGQALQINSEGHIGINNPSNYPGLFNIRNGNRTIGHGGDFSQSAIYITESNGNMGIDGNSIYGEQDLNLGTAIDSDGVIRVNTRGSERIIIDKNGKVGIGCSPSQKFDFYGNKLRFKESRLEGEMSIQLISSKPRFEHKASSPKFVFCNGGYGGDWDWAEIECKIVTEKSDSASKENFKELKGKSLSKVLKLKGYSYNWKGAEIKKRNAGLLAQQVERIMPEAVNTVDSTGEKLLTYSHFIPYLVEAIKEQQDQINAGNELVNQERENNKELTRVLKEQNQKIDQLEKEIALIKAQCCANNFENTTGGNKKKKSGTITGEDDTESLIPSLEQNSPNPFSEETVINYYLPEETAKATLYIYDLQGKLLVSHEIEQFGQTSFTIQARELNPGIYFYSLITDRQLIDTKQMILID